MKRIEKKDSRGINYCIDPRIELLSIVQVLAGELDSNFKDYYFKSGYSKMLANKFDSFKNDEAILEFKRLKNNGIYFNNNMILKLGISPFLSLNIKDEILNNYSKLLMRFAKKIDFENFYNSQIDFYNKVLDFNISKTNPNNQYLKNLEDYYQDNSYLVNIIFKFIQSDWGESITEKNGIDNISGVISNDKNYLFLNDLSERSLIFHECSHHYVSLLFKNEDDFFTKTESLFDLVPNDSLAKHEYRFYNSFIEENYVRAITLYLMYTNNYISKHEYEKFIDNEISYGFIFTNSICELLENYSFYNSLKAFKKVMFKKISTS